jgi:hypothetical protein
MGASLMSKPTFRAVLGFALVLLLAGCREDNPAYLGKSPPRDSAPAPGNDVPLADASPDTTVPPDDVVSLPDGTPDASPASGPDEGPQGDPDASAVGGDVAPDSGADRKREPDLLPGHDDAGDVLPIPTDAADAKRDGRSDGLDARDVQPVEEVLARDAEPEGAVPSDAPSEGARDATDGPALDLPRDVPTPNDVPVMADQADEVAVDSGPICQEHATREVLTPDNPLVGACHAGSQVCSNGTWVQVTAEVLPADSDPCNGIDDNCNGIVDEDCSDTCIVVAPDGDDEGDGSAQKPFGTIERAITAAGATDGGSGVRVCVVGGDSCSASARYAIDGQLVMSDGVAVQGNYALSSGGLRYCGANTPPTTTIEFKAIEQGVLFNQTISARTELSGFSIARFGDSSPGSASISAVLVAGAQKVALSRIFITDGPSARNSYGVYLSGGGQAIIVGSAIGGGRGRENAVGVYVDGSTVELRNNCDSLAGGRCTTTCDDEEASLGIRGRDVLATADTGIGSSAVFITNAPAPSTVVANMLCGGPSNLSESAASGAGVAALRCDSGGCGTVKANTIAGGTGRSSIGLALTGRSAVVDGNRIESGCGESTSTGVLLEYSSARLQNNLILGSRCSSGGGPPPTFRGLHMVFGGDPSAAGGEPSVSSNDIEPQSKSTDCRSFGVLVDRTDTAELVAGSLRNNIVSAGICSERYGVSESERAALRAFDHNDLYAPEAGTTPVVLYRRNGVDVTAAMLSNDSKNISELPGYVSATDLHLVSGSKCVDRGTVTDAPSEDADGTTRPQGDGFDIGAFELKK